MWNTGEIVMWRGIFRSRVWHAQSMIVVRDTPQEIALALLPDAEAVTPEGYANGKQQDKRRWFFKDKPWKLERHSWHTNRVLCLVEPGKYYATMLFWGAASGEFLCYYMNFQLPCRRGAHALDSLDLDLDLIIYPDFRLEWKDLDDYQSAIAHGVILSEWTQAIEADKSEIERKIAKREYPFDGRWLDWKPDPGWAPPKLPADWEDI